MSSFVTTRSRNSRLWFINNPGLEEAILGYAAKFTARYGAKLYALAIEGNHIQGPALFPRGNRAAFMRDLNSCVARAVPRFTPEYEGGRFWGRRYSSEFLPGDADIEEYFFYTVLQPVKDGLIEHLSEYPGYNCFYDAINGIRRQFEVVRWKEYNDAKRRDASASIKDFTERVTLHYARLPGYEKLSQKEYARVMMQKLEERRVAIVAQRAQQGLSFVGRENLRTTRRGARARNSKTSTRYSHRPRVLSVCPLRRSECKAWYFQIYFAYKEASRRYRTGELEVRFPEGTYKPYLAPTAPPP